MYCTAFFYLRAINIASSTRYRDVNVCVTLTVKSDSRRQRSSIARRKDNWKDRMTGVGALSRASEMCSAQMHRAITAAMLQKYSEKRPRFSPRAILARVYARNKFAEQKWKYLCLYHSAYGMNGTLTYILAACATRLHLINLRTAEGIANAGSLGISSCNRIMCAVKFVPLFIVNNAFV